MQAFNKCTKTSYYNRLVNSQIESNNLKDTLKKTLINIVQKRIQSQGFTSEKDFGDEDYRKVLKYLLQSNALGNVLLDAGIKEVSKYRLSSTLAKDKIFALKKYVEITTDITLEISTIAPAPISQLFNINLRPNNALREDKKNLNFFMQQTAMERRNPDHFQLKPAESILSDFQLLKNLLTKKAYSQKATAQILECHQKKLAQLNLNACELNEFPASEILAYLPQLKSINLSNNFIKNLPTELFNQLPELQKLNLAHNQIEIIPEFMAPNQLVHLNLSNNHIQEIPTYSLDQLANLQTLNLADNYLSKISSNNFTRLNNLQSLYLSANQISEISENAFINLQNLHTLTLDNNQIQNIKTNNFNGLKNLLQLDLSYNKIEIIPPLAFNELNNLQVLNLRNGKLKELSAKAFFGLNSLKELELKYNSIESIDNTAFKALPTLKMLNLANNNIEQLPELPDVQKINFTKNKIKLLLKV